MNETEFFKWSLKKFDEIETSEEFKTIDSEISKFFYLSSLRLKETTKLVVKY